MPDLLEFEEPVGVLLKEIEALSLMPRTPERERSIEHLRGKIKILGDIESPFDDIEWDALK